MKNLVKLPFAVLLGSAFLASCGAGNTGSASKTTTITPVTSVSVASDSVTGDFSIATDDGAYTQDGSIYTLSSAGTYTLSGHLDGMIYVTAGDEDDVEIVLNDASINYAENSPIFIASANEVKIKAKNGTSNFVTDGRAEQTTEDDSQGAGAIYARADLKLVGQGSLTVTGTYNNGVHTSKDLKIKNLTLTSLAPNNAIKGNDSVTIESGTIAAISTAGDAIKTSSTDLSSSSKQRGSVEISGGSISLYAGGDGIDAAYDVTIYDGVSEDDPTVSTVPSVAIYTNKYSTYSDSSILSVADLGIVAGFGPGGPGGAGGPGGGAVPTGDTKNTDKADGSAKGIKAANAVCLQGGVTNIYAYDDGIHANSGDAFDSGAKGVGLIEVSGGDTTVFCTDDGAHADGNLNIKGGAIAVSQSHEGLEANVINVSGGEAIAYGNDDGVNASSQINVSGGYLFTAVSPSGDTDGIDSNGSYTQTGGVVIACGPNNMNAAALDADGAVRISGGTFVSFGTLAVRPTSSLTSSTKSGSYGGKAYTLKFANGSIETATLNSSGYSGVTCYSELGALSSIS